MNTYDYTPNGKSLDQVKEEYLSLLKRSIRQNALHGTYTDKHLEKVISVFNHIPSKVFKFKCDHVITLPGDTACFKLKCYNKCSVAEVCITLKANALKDNIKKLKSKIFELYQIQDSYKQKDVKELTDPYQLSDKEYLDKMAFYKQKAEKNEKDFRKILEYLKKKESQLTLLFFTLEKENIAKRVKAFCKRSVIIFHMESFLSKAYEDMLPEKDEKVFLKDDFGDPWLYTDYPCPIFHAEYKIEKKINKYHYFQYANKENFKCVYKNKDGTLYDTRRKNLNRYLPYIKGFEELYELIPGLAKKTSQD